MLSHFRISPYANWSTVFFFLEDLKPMIWNDQAFDHLVYDEQQKDLVLSFVENHNKAGNEPSMRDVIIAKG